MRGEPRIVRRRPIPRRQPSQLAMHAAVMGMVIAAFLFVMALASVNGWQGI